MDGTDHVDDIAVTVCEMLIVQHYQIRPVEHRNLCHSLLRKSYVRKDYRLKVPDPLLQALTIISEAGLADHFKGLSVMCLECIGDYLKVRIQIKEPVAFIQPFSCICCVFNHCLTDNTGFPGLVIDHIHDITDLLIHCTGLSERAGQIRRTYCNHIQTLYLQDLIKVQETLFGLNHYHNKNLVIDVLIILGYIQIHAIVGTTGYRTASAMSFRRILAGIHYQLCLFCSLNIRDVDTVKTHVKRAVDRIEVNAAHADGAVSSCPMDGTHNVHTVTVSERIVLVVHNHAVQPASGHNLRIDGVLKSCHGTENRFA